MLGLRVTCSSHVHALTGHHEAQVLGGGAAGGGLRGLAVRRFWLGGGGGDGGGHGLCAQGEGGCKREKRRVVSARALRCVEACSTDQQREKRNLTSPAPAGPGH